jgi:hypothetical protein
VIESHVSGKIYIFSAGCLHESAGFTEAVRVTAFLSARGSAFNFTFWKPKLYLALKNITPTAGRLLLDII